MVRLRLLWKNQPKRRLWNGTTCRTTARKGCGRRTVSKRIVEMNYRTAKASSYCSDAPPLGALPESEYPSGPFRVGQNKLPNWAVLFKSRGSMAKIVAVVDDDSSVRRSLDRLIRSARLEVSVFASAEEFLASDHHNWGGEKNVLHRGGGSRG